MRITRRGLFAMIAAAFTPAARGLPLAVVRAFDRHMMGRCECPGCQYARGFIRRGGYEFYPDVFTAPPNQLLTMQEITSKSLHVLENNTVVLPGFYRE